jgi:hypothetical protein
MKVIFLDIDGTMTTFNSMKMGWAYRKKRPKDNRKYSNFVNDRLTLSRKCIKTLNRLVVTTRAKVVISSEWRYGTPTRYFQRLFCSKGFCGEIIDRTPTWNKYKDMIGIKTINDLELFWNHERGNEIRLWLEWNKSKNIESYLVIDDDVSDIEPLHEGKFIQTNMEQGFQGEGLLQEAIKKLKGE